MAVPLISRRVPGRGRREEKGGQSCMQCPEGRVGEYRGRRAARRKGGARISPTRSSIRELSTGHRVASA
eukprot:3407837-Rhodomonas_salina.1